MLVKTVTCLLLLVCPAVFSLGQREAFVPEDDDADVAFGLEQLENLYTSNNISNQANPKVVIATKQVVSGTKIDLVVQVDKPSRDYDDEVELCDISIWSRPWLNDTQLSEPIVCGVSKSIRSFIEEKSNTKSNNQMYAVAKDWSVSNYDGSYTLNWVDLFSTNCSMAGAEPFLNTEVLYEKCTVADNAIKMFTCSAGFHVNEDKTDFESEWNQC